MRGRAIWISVALVLGLLVILTGGDGFARASPLLLLASFQVPTLVVAMAGAAIGFAVAMAAGALALADRQPPSQTAARAVQPMSILLIGILLAVGVDGDKLNAVLAAIIFVLMVLALIAGTRCIDALGRGEPIGTESYWGGLGGSGGGWQIFPTTALALLSLSLLGAAVTIAFGDLKTSDTKDQTTEENSIDAASEANVQAPESNESEALNVTASNTSETEEVPSADNAGTAQ